MREDFRYFDSEIGPRQINQIWLVSTHTRLLTHMVTPLVTPMAAASFLMSLGDSDCIETHCLLPKMISGLPLAQFEAKVAAHSE